MRFEVDASNAARTPTVDLTALSCLAGLRELRCSGGIHDGLECLDALTRPDLSAWHGIDEVVLARLRGWTGLRVLSLQSCSLSDECLRFIGGLFRLRSLSLPRRRARQ